MNIHCEVIWNIVMSPNFLNTLYMYFVPFLLFFYCLIHLIYLFVCLFGFNVAFKIICHITTVSGCDRELNAHFYSAASL